MLSGLVTNHACGHKAEGVEGMLRLVVAVALVVSASSAPHTWTRQLDELQTTKLYSNDNVMSKCHCGGDAVHQVFAWLVSTGGLDMCLLYQDNVHPVSSGCIGEYWDSMEHGPEVAACYYF